jgi:hypothetical protein
MGAAHTLPADIKTEGRSGRKEKVATDRSARAARLGVAVAAARALDRDHVFAASGDVESIESRQRVGEGLRFSGYGGDDRQSRRSGKQESLGSPDHAGPPLGRELCNEADDHNYLSKSRIVKILPKRSEALRSFPAS